MSISERKEAIDTTRAAEEPQGELEEPSTRQIRSCQIEREHSGLYKKRNLDTTE